MNHQLIIRHPKLFEGKELPTLGVPEGWFNLVDVLFGRIEEMMPDELMPYFFLSTVEERYAKLSINFQGACNEEVEELLDLAEWQSEHTCQECSDHGHRRTDGSLRCLCDFCEREREIRVRRKRY